METETLTTRTVCTTCRVSSLGGRCDCPPSAQPTMARSYGSAVWHDMNRGAAYPRTMCGRDARRMARFSPSDLPSGERSHKPCARCRKARGV